MPHLRPSAKRPAGRRASGVRPVGLDAPAFGTTAADFPQMFRNGKFRTELRDASIDRNPAHDWNQRLFLLFVPFKVEQNLERATHKLCFLGLQK